MGQAEIAEVEALAEVYRGRLHDLSWFMRTLNEHIARRANAEDGVKGRFWEGRFKSQALLDEKALLAAMAYVDLNPVRAGLAETPEASDYTSIQERIGGLPEEVGSEAGSQETITPKDPEVMLDGERLRPEAETHVLPQASLMPFDATAQTPWAVPLAFDDYLDLVDWTGRALRMDKRGYIDGTRAQDPRPAGHRWGAVYRLFRASSQGVRNGGRRTGITRGSLCPASSQVLAWHPGCASGVCSQTGGVIGLSRSRMTRAEPGSIVGRVAIGKCVVTNENCRLTNGLARPNTAHRVQELAGRLSKGHLEKFKVSLQNKEAPLCPCA